MSLPMNSPVFDAPALRMLAYACGIAGQFAGSRDGPSVFREALSTLPALARDISWDSWIEDSRPFSQIGPRRPYGPSPAGRGPRGRCSRRSPARRLSSADRRRPLSRGRLLVRHRAGASAARRYRTGVDRRAHGQPHALHQPQWLCTRHAPGGIARPWRSGPDGPAVAACQAAPGSRLPDRDPRFRAGGSGPAAHAGRARLLYG